MYANDTSLFSIIQDPNESAKYLNLDISVISQLAYQWKILFNPDPKKSAHEVIFFRRKNEETHSSVFYDNIEVSRTDSQNHLRLVLDNKLTFKKHVKDKLNKLKRILVLIKLKDFVIYCLAILLLLFINHLLGQI